MKIRTRHSPVRAAKYRIRIDPVPVPISIVSVIRHQVVVIIIHIGVYHLLHHGRVHLHPVTSSGIPLPSIGRILNSMLDLVGEGSIEGTVAVSLTMIVFRKAVKCVVNYNFSGSAGLPGITVITGPLKTDDIGLIQHKIMKPDRFHLVAPGGVCHGRCPLDIDRAAWREGGGPAEEAAPRSTVQTNE